MDETTRKEAARRKFKRRVIMLSAWTGHFYAMSLILYLEHTSSASSTAITNRYFYSIHFGLPVLAAVVMSWATVFVIFTVRGLRAARSSKSNLPMRR